MLEAGIDFITRPRIRSALVPLAPNIERIAFFDVFPDWELLSCFAGLTSVRMDIRTYRYRPGNTLAGSGSPALKSIALRDYAIINTVNPLASSMPELAQEAFFTWLSTTATHAQSSLRSASFMVTKSEDLPVVAELLSTHTRLQHLTLQLSTPTIAASIGTSHLNSLHLEARLHRQSLIPILCLLQRATFPFLRTLSLSFHGQGRTGRTTTFHPFRGEEYSPTSHVLPEHLASQLTGVNVRFEYFSFIVAYEDFLSVFGDAQRRGILNVHKEGIPI